MANADHPQAAAAAYQFLLTVCHHALSYDLQVQPRAAVQRFLQHHDAAMLHAGEEILQIPLTTQNQLYQQAVFLLTEGGLGLVTNMDRHPAFYLSTLLSDLPMLIQQCTRMGYYHTDILNTT